MLVPAKAERCGSQSIFPNAQVNHSPLKKASVSTVLGITTQKAFPHAPTRSYVSLSDLNAPFLL